MYPIVVPHSLYSGYPSSHPHLPVLPITPKHAELHHMIPLLRRLSKSAPSSALLSKLMDVSSSFGGSQRLLALAQQLRLYTPPTISEDIEEQNLEESAGKVVSQVGFAESATPIAQDSERFRSKRAAVLVCLFEGDAGDLRVILTKRSSRLSTHSGQWNWIRLLFRRKSVESKQ